MTSAADRDGLVTLMDERAIIKVMLRFGRSLDRGDWAGYRSCFTDQINVDFERLTGVPEIRVSADDWTRFAELILSPVRRHHVYSNFDADIEGDRAFLLTYMTARHWKSTDLGASVYNQFGWYNAWFERRGEEWKIAFIKHDFQWVDGNNSLLDTNAPELRSQMEKVFSPANIQAAKSVKFLPLR
jgi:hypothetical protein